MQYEVVPEIAAPKGLVGGRQREFVQGCQRHGGAVEQPAASAEVPQQINYQGYLVDGTGVPVTDIYEMTFSIYDVASGPDAPLWSETQSTVNVANGVFNVQIGQDPSGNPFPAGLFEDPLYLGVQVVSTNVASARLAPIGPGAHKRNAQSRCLLLTGDGIDKDQQGVITNTKTYSVGTLLTLFTDFGEHQIKLTDWVESNNSFIHYHFEYLEGHDKVSDETQETERNKNDFNKLWNEL